MEIDFQADLLEAMGLLARLKVLEQQCRELADDLLHERIRRREVEFNSARLHLNYLSIIRMAVRAGVPLATGIDEAWCDRAVDKMQPLQEAALAAAGKIAAEAGCQLRLKPMGPLMAFELVSPDLGAEV